MKAAILQFDEQQWTVHPSSKNFNIRNAQLVLCFAAKKMLTGSGIYEKIKNKFPSSEVVMCSTAGEIFHNVVQDNSMVVVALYLEKTQIQTATVNLADFKSSYDAGAALVKKLQQKDLSYLMILSDGSVVDGSDLVKGLNESALMSTIITGGLAGDGADFKATLVGLNIQPAEGNIVAIGFYGSNICVSHGSQGGWDSFGPERLVTRSSGNKLFEIDEKNALDMYKKYLGPDADQLPGSALLFPLSVIKPGTIHPIVRTILSIDHGQKSMTFAGSIPEGSRVRFMRANFDKLTSAAARAANNTINGKFRIPDFSMLISCVGRKLILGSRTEEEVDAVLNSLGNDTPVAGFYSYGEISPFNDGGSCRLHNQTMTITSFYELP
jgi:hypothetical protein